MAQSTSVVYHSDLSQSVIKSDTPTVEFGLDGTTYEIDLTDAEQKRLRDALAQYLDVARRVTARQSKGGKSASKPASDAAEVRAWAKENGFTVPERGRIPAEVREAYASK